MNAFSCITPMLARLIPRLSSPFHGERLATLGAIERTLRAKGFDFNDLAAALDRPEPAPGIVFREPSSAPVRGSAGAVEEALERIAWLLEEPAQLSPWEEKFLRSLRGQLWAGRPPSEKQAKCLEDIYVHCFVTGDRP